MFTQALMLTGLTFFAAAGATTEEIVAGDFDLPTFAETVLFSTEWWTIIGVVAGVICAVFAVLTYFKSKKTGNEQT